MESMPPRFLDPSAVAAMDDIQARADVFLETHRIELMALIQTAVDDAARTRVVLEHVDRSVAHSVAPYRDQLACGRGCSHCCHQLVMLQHGEALVLAEAVRSLDPAARAQVRDQSRAQMAVIRSASQAHPGEAVSEGGRRFAEAVHEAGLPCPLLDLERHACRVYAARPSPCRATYSFDADRCSRHFGAEGRPPVQLTEEMGIQMRSDPLIPSDRRLYPIGAIESLVSAGRL